MSTHAADLRKKVKKIEKNREYFFCIYVDACGGLKRDFQVLGLQKRQMFCAIFVHASTHAQKIRTSYAKIAFCMYIGHELNITGI